MFFSKRRSQPPDFERQRHAMVSDQLMARGIRDERVLRAMATVRRESFVPEAQRTVAYRDGAQAIAEGQTISQPYIVAAMSEALSLTGDEHVLEVGTGSGYQTAVLAQLAARVTTIERIDALSKEAERALAGEGVDNVEFLVGDGAEGCSRHAPWSHILVTAAAVECPAALIEQLAEGGRLVGPFGRKQHQVLQVITRIDGQLRRSNLFPVRFVPLISG